MAEQVGRDEATLDRIERALQRQALAWWFRRCNPTYQVASHHEKIISALERVERGECRRLIITMPPRHGKTELASIAFPAWFLGRHPENRVILASYAAALAHTNSKHCRNRFGEHAPQVFGHRVADDSAARDSWDVSGYRGGMVAAGVDGPLTGKGADLAIIDDPFKDESEAYSAAIREGVWSWYVSVLSTRLHPGARVVLIQTRWHQDDLAGRLLNGAGGEPWELLNLPMVDHEGSPLWPGRYSQNEIEVMQKRGNRTWQALYQGNPVPDEGGMFKRHWWKYYDQVPPILDTVVQSWDMAFKGTATSDFVVGQVWGKRHGNYYLLDQARGRWDFTETCYQVKKLSDKWPAAQAKIVEDAANGPAVIAAMRDMLPGLIAVKPEGGKESRAAAVSPLMESGNVYIPKGVSWVEQYVDEFCAFPLGKNDDQVDSTTQALNRLMRMDGKVYGLPSVKNKPIVQL